MGKLAVPDGRAADNASTGADVPKATAWQMCFGVSRDSTRAAACEAGVMSIRAARHRRGRQTPAAAVLVDELEAFSDDELLYLLVPPIPLGAWTATLASNLHRPARSCNGRHAYVTASSQPAKVIPNAVQRRSWPGWTGRCAPPWTSDPRPDRGSDRAGRKVVIATG
jgi:hypothetical protein